LPLKVELRKSRYLMQMTEGRYDPQACRKTSRRPRREFAMRTRLVGSLTVWLIAAGLAWADPARPVQADGSPARGTPAPLTLPNAQALPNAQTAPAKPAAGAAAPGAGTATPNGITVNGLCNQAPANPVGPPVVDLRDYHAGPCYKWWLTGDYLLWWVKDGPLPVALVTTSPPTSSGVLGAPGTGTVLGNTGFGYGALSGGRIEGGTWLNECHTLGVEAGFFWLGQGTTSFAAVSNAAGTPLLARPFFNAITTAPSAALITFPGAFTGGASVTTASQFWGDDVNLVRNLYASPRLVANLLAGFRNLNLEENLEMTSSSVALTPPPASGLVIATAPGVATPVGALTVVDRFGTVNHFYGGQLGVSAQYWMGRLVLTSLVKVALGVNHESVNAMGKTTATGVFPGGGTATATSGLLAASGGNYGLSVPSTTDYFNVSPTVRLGLGYQVTRNLRAQFGYNFIYLNGVARPGDQINPVINPSLVPSSPAFGSLTGPRSPTLSIRQTDFWAQGLNFGLTLTY
jgi:hypothetical protein